MYDLLKDLSFEDPRDILVANKDIICSVLVWTSPNSNLNSLLEFGRRGRNSCLRLENLSLPILFGCKTFPSIVNRSLSMIVGKHQQLVSSKNRSLLLACTPDAFRDHHVAKTCLKSPLSRGKSGSFSL